MSKEISDNTESSMTPLKRREFLLMAAGASLYLALPSIAFAEGAKWVSLGKADLFVKDQPRQVVLPDNGGTLWVTRGAKNKYTAVSAVCTHKGGILNWDAAQKRYICPLHAAAFDPEGKNVAGTRKHPEEKLPALPVVSVKEKKGEVLADISTLPKPAPKPEAAPTQPTVAPATP